MQEVIERLQKAAEYNPREVMGEEEWSVPVRKSDLRAVLFLLAIAPKIDEFEQLVANNPKIAPGT